MDIGTTVITLEKLLSGSDTRYQVPDYQRNYAWKEDEIEELWGDVVRLLVHDEQYFMGSVVLNQEEHQEDQFDIVDGQQRLATFSILFSVIRDYARAFSEDSRVLPRVPRNEETKRTALRLATMSEDRLLYRTEPDHFFLALNNKDSGAFDTVVRRHSPLLTDEQLQVVPNESRVLKAEKYLSRYVLDEFENDEQGLARLDAFFVALHKRLVFLKITVSDDYDAFVLFESLNSKGLNLSTSDLLKNKLLMSCKDRPDVQNRVLEGWDESMKMLEKSRFGTVDFVRHYWVAFEAEVTTKELYKVLKRRIDSGALDVEDFTVSLYDKAEQYAEITADTLVWPAPEISRGSLDWHLAQIHTLGYSICTPAILYCVSERPALAAELARLSLNYLFRYITVGEGAVRVAKQAFRAVLDGLKDGRPDTDVLGHLRPTTGRVGDQAFREDLSRFRTKDNRLAKYMLTALHLKAVNYETIPNHREVHLEHILPVKFDLWAEEGFDPGDRRMEEWVNCLGNMTLLHKKTNQQISNRVFSAKVSEYRPLEGGDGSSFPMTNSIYERYQQGSEAWTTTAISERAEQFAGDAIDIWSLTPP
jgi:hypothetical protein